MNSDRTIAFHTLGCKLNFAETSSIARELSNSGYQKVEFDANPDVFLINTCSVTENADRECRLIVNRALAINPEAVVVVTGCFAQLKPESIASIPGVDLVLGASEKFQATAYLNDLFQKGVTQIKSCEIADLNEFVSSWSAGERTRTFLKVQDGCNYNCSFCTIPLARGRSRSNAISNVLEDVKVILKEGAKEIVLTGINLGDFGIYNADTGKHESGFYELARCLDEMDGKFRIRISSIEPNLLQDRIIKLVSESDKFVPHFHIPLQSGSDRILKKMKRRYLRNVYESRVQYIKTLMPDCCIGVDVITGFPGETENDFMETYNFLNEIPVSYFHVFTYSERENTPAAEMDEAVEMGIRKERNRMLRILSAKKQRKFYESQLGKIFPVLFEADHKDGFMHGFTPNYVRVKTSYDASLINSIIPCKMNAVAADGTMFVEMELPQLIYS